jgi:hypothetical protein
MNGMHVRTHAGTDSADRHCLPVPLIVCSLMAPFTVMALGAGLQVDTSDPSGPTAIEQALIEHACRGTRAGGAPETNPYQECLSAQLLSLRADLGRDLGRLSTSERRTLDSVCGDIRAAGGREAYLECLSARLVSLRNRHRGANPAPSDGSALASPLVSAPTASLAPPARPRSWWSWGLWVGGTLLTVVVAVGGVLLAAKARRVPRKCRVCGADVPETGGLCPTCRHEAAEAVRSAALERAELQRTQEEEQRRQGGQGEEQRREKALQDEGEARLRQQEEARQREEDARAREDEARQRQQEEARQMSQLAVVSEEVSDPYLVLGVPRDASQEDISVAYQAAKLKYDPEQVTHLSMDIQEHFKAKALAVDRAYQALTEGPREEGL